MIVYHVEDEVAGPVVTVCLRTKKILKKAFPQNKGIIHIYLYIYIQIES